MIYFSSSPLANPLSLLIGRSSRCFDAELQMKATEICQSFEKDITTGKPGMPTCNARIHVKAGEGDFSKGVFVIKFIGHIMS